VSFAAGARTFANQTHLSIAFENGRLHIFAGSPSSASDAPFQIYLFL
jgi:hypothetical protein